MIFLLIAAWFLAGCNVVVTERPMFKTAGEPALREGIWIRPEGDCPFDAVAPAAQLPDCANAMILKNGVMRSAGPQRPDSTPDIGEEISYLLTTGEPRIIQYGLTVKGKKFWVYQGVEPVSTDAEGKLVAVKVWTALCGPPPPKEPGPDGKYRYVTDKPLPGLTIRDSNCFARKVDAVINSVRESRVWDEDVSELRWLRDNVE